MTPRKLALIAAALFTGIGITSASATMPVNNLSGIEAGTNVENVRYVCGRYRCYWRPNYSRSYGYYPSYSYGYASQSYAYAPGYGYYSGPRYYRGGSRHHRRW